MAVPDFQSLMRPLLAAHSDGGEHSNRDLVGLLATQFSLSDEERREMLPSGGARLFDNRVGWAKTHMTQAGLISSPRRAISIITQRGFQALKDFPDRIDLKTLNHFEDYREFRNRKKNENSPTEGSPPVICESDEDEQTPEELLDSAYLQVRSQIEAELLRQLKESPPDFLGSSSI